MDKRPNPYAAPIAAETATDKCRLRLVPRTPGGCMLLALFLWPLVMLVTDFAGMFFGPLLKVDDFGLAAGNVTLPVTWPLAITLWIRAFLIRERTAAAGWIAAVASLPFWFVFTTFITFLFFPFGRISSTF